MIRIYKHPDAPKSLTKQTSWSEEDVIIQLKSDQHGKCYLCERTMVTDFQVEHYMSRTNYPALKFAWKNLFWGCSYCNGKKSDSYDNILDPTKENIEDLIEHTFDFPNSKVVFKSTSTPTAAPVESTIELLGKIFNGSGKIRKIREQQFYDYAKSRITSFQNVVLAWLDSPTEEIKNVILEQLSIESEFLGFKYWIIRSNKRLFEAFGGNIKWNKI